MNKEVWYQMMKNWIKSLDSIVHLEKQGILDDEEGIKAREKLLEDVIDTFIGETEDE